jgi:hypothetical protein
MPSIPGPTPNTNVRKYPGNEGKLRKMSAGGAPASPSRAQIVKPSRGPARTVEGTKYPRPKEMQASASKPRLRRSEC